MLEMHILCVDLVCDYCVNRNTMHLTTSMAILAGFCFILMYLFSKFNGRFTTATITSTVNNAPILAETATRC